MPLDFGRRAKAVGAKQSRKAILGGLAEKVFFASDAEEGVVLPLIKLCGEEGVSFDQEHTMRELGAASGISVGAAVVTLLRRDKNGPEV